MHGELGASRPRVSRPIHDVIDGLLQLFEALALVGLDRHDRNAEVGREPGGIDLEPLPSATSIMFRASTTGMPSSSTCVARYRLRSRMEASTMTMTASGRSLALLMAEDDVDGQHLIGTAGGQAVGAGQVDDLDGLAVKMQLALLGLDGDARDNCRPAASCRPGR